MAETDKSFPKLAEANWWKLRDLFKRRVPTSVTPSYLASALAMSDSSAKANIIFPFRKIGIIDEEGKPTNLAYDWRDDDKYPAVCNSILESCYPQEIRDLYHDKNQDLSGLVNWFMSSARCGEPTAKMYSAFYRLLLQADPSGQTQSQNQPSTPKPKRIQKVAKEPSVTKTVNSSSDEAIQVVSEKQLSASQAPLHFSTVPQLHVNIQLHIAPETTADQIDKIFESMAKHLKTLSTLAE